MTNLIKPPKTIKHPGHAGKACDGEAERRQRAIALLRSWREEGDEAEQRETFEALEQGLNAHHSSGRTIYP